MKKKNDKKESFYDDGRTIADMNVEGMPWYISHKAKENRSGLQGLELTKEERKAMILGMLSALMPLIIVVILTFTGVFLFLDIFWLR